MCLSVLLFKLWCCDERWDIHDRVVVLWVFPPEHDASFGFISFRAIDVFARPLAAAYSLILIPGLCRLGLGVFLQLRDL